MKVLIIHPPWPGPGYGLRSQNRWPRKKGDKTNRYPIYLCYVGTVLKANGYGVEFIDSVFRDLDYEQTYSEIEKRKPDFIFIETATPTINYDIKFIDEIKKRFPSIKVVLAGTHVTYFPERTLAESKVDVIIKGEMDYTTLNAINALAKNTPLSEVKGIAYRDGDKIINNEPAPLIENLDELPFPDRDLIPHQWYFEGHVVNKPFTFIVGGRGCPFKCTYCLWPNTWQNHEIRYRSVQNVVAEIKWLKEKYGMKEILFDEDTFNVHKWRVIDLCKAMVDNNATIKFSCSCRVNPIDEEMLYWMKKAGCRLIFYGAESANQSTLNKVKKGITVEQIRHAFKLTKKVGIAVHGNFMLGFPWETEEDTERTIQLALETDPDTVQFSLVFPHPGTEMYEEAQKEGWFYDGIAENFDAFDMVKGPVMKAATPKHVLDNAISKAHARFFFRPSYMMKQALKVRSTEDLKRLFKGAHSVIKGKILYNLKVAGTD